MIIITLIAITLMLLAMIGFALLACTFKGYLEYIAELQQEKLDLKSELTELQMKANVVEQMAHPIRRESWPDIEKRGQAHERTAGEQASRDRHPSNTSRKHVTEPATVASLLIEKHTQDVGDAVLQDPPNQTYTPEHDINQAEVEQPQLYTLEDEDRCIHRSSGLECGYPKAEHPINLSGWTHDFKAGATQFQPVTESDPFVKTHELLIEGTAATSPSVGGR